MKKISKVGDYEIISSIGSGLTATVFEGKAKDGTRVSVKSIESSFYRSEIGGQLIKNEAKILSMLNHPNVLRFVEKVEANGKVHIITNYCEGGDLQGYLAKHGKLSQKQAFSLTKSIVQGCIYLKQKNVIHRDIKPSNIFLHKGHPVLADFGFAVLASDKKLMSVNAGSPLYMPLQSLRDRQFTDKSDVFAVGVCLFEMLTGRTPWPANTEKQLMESLKKAPKMSTSLAPSTTEILNKCLSCDPNQRPNFSELLKLINRAQNQENKLVEIPRQKSVSFNYGPSLKKKGNQNKENQNHNKTGLTYKNKSISVYQKQNTSRPAKMEGEFLSRVNPDDFAFLPGSVITKFKCIMHKYRAIVHPSAQNGQAPVPTEQDSLITEIQHCTTEPQLCRSIESFMRRLFRLTKNYKEYKNCLANLEALHERVIGMTL